MDEYIFENNAEDFELGRLKLVEAAFDAGTIALLEQTGVAGGWSCMELGAGAGSIAEWMGRRVGSPGLVLAVDKKTKYLDRLSGPPYRVLEGEFLSLDFEQAVDLLHARYVLIHNGHAQAMLDRMRHAVKQGGYVLLEEPDFTSAAVLNPAADAACQRVNEAICRMFTDRGLDPAYGLRLPREMEKVGLEIIESKVMTHLCPGGAPIANVMAESAIALRDKYRTTGIATDQDIDRYVELARDRRYWSVYYSTVSIIARVR